MGAFGRPPESDVDASVAPVCVACTPSAVPGVAVATAHTCGHTHVSPHALATPFPSPTQATTRPTSSPPAPHVPLLTPKRPPSAHVSTPIPNTVSAFCPTPDYNPWTECSRAAVMGDVATLPHASGVVVDGGDGDAAGGARVTSVSLLAPTGEIGGNPCKNFNARVRSPLRAPAGRVGQVLFLVVIARTHIEMDAGDGAARGLMVHLAAQYLRPPEAWAPAEETAAECAFMQLLRDARGGMMASRRWRHLILPEDLTAFYARRQRHIRALAAAAVPESARPEHGNVQDRITPLRKGLAALPPSWVSTAILYGGGGGVDMGLPTWCDRRVCVEWDEDVAAIHRLNSPTPVLVADILAWRDTLRRMRPYGPFGFIQLSPPCQPHSLSTCKEAKERNAAAALALAVATARLLIALSPGVFLLENVERMLAPPATLWRAVEPLYAAAGYTLSYGTVNAMHCGVPQSRTRLWVLGVRGSGAAVSLAFTQALERLRDVSESRSVDLPRLRTVAEMLPGVRAAYYLAARNGKSACVLLSCRFAPTLRTTCHRYPSRLPSGALDYVPRKQDAPGCVEDATRLSVAMRGAIMGFPMTHKWGTSLLGGPADALAARVQGNAVPPPMMAMVAQAALDAGAFAQCWQVPVSLPVVPPPTGIPILRRDLTPSVMIDGKPLPAWHIRPARARQSPLMAAWRTTHTHTTPASEWTEGWGAREGAEHDIVGDVATRPFLIDDVALMRRVAARIAAAPLGGLDRVVTGAPRKCRAAQISRSVHPRRLLPEAARADPGQRLRHRL